MERHANQPFAILGVNTDKDPDEYRRKIEEHEISWTSAWQGSTDGEWPQSWGVTSYPTILVLDQNLVVRHVGPRGQELERVVAELLAELE